MTKVNRKPFAYWKKNSILIVDDATLMRSMLQDVIKTNGLAKETFEAVDGNDAIKKYSTNACAVFFLNNKVSPGLPEPSFGDGSVFLV